MFKRIVTAGLVSYYYPLPEEPPVLGQTRFRFVQLERILSSSFADLQVNADNFFVFLRSRWLRNRGFFVLDPMDPHIDLDLDRISRYLYIIRILGRLDSLNQEIPDFFRADAVSWILRHVFSSCDSNPFKKPSLYRYVPDPADKVDHVFAQLRELHYWGRGISETICCKDVSSSLSILWLLDHLHELRGVCDPYVLAAHILKLQMEEGFFAPVPPRLAAGKYDRNRVTLQAVVACSILDQYFDTRAIASMRTTPLLQYLSNAAAELLSQPTISPYDLFTIFEICSSAEMVLGSIKRAPAPLGIFEDLDRAVMRSLGLASLWQEYNARSESVESFWSGLKFSESLSTNDSQAFDRLVAEFPTEETKKASWYRLFPAFAILSLVNANGAIGITLGALKHVTLERSEHLHKNFEWQVLCLPFVLRHCPLLTFAKDPLFWFAGERNLCIPLRNTTAAPVFNVRFRRLSTGGRSVSYYPTTSRKSSEFRLTVASASMSRENIDSQTEENLIVRFKKRPRSPRYPFIGFPGPELSCRYQQEVFSLHGTTISVQLMPKRESIAQTIQRELPKQHYDPTLTTSAVQELLRTSGIHLPTSLAMELYRSVVPSAFARWIAQFSADDRLLAFRLYRGLRFFSYDEIRRQFRSLLSDRLPSDVVRKALFIGVGKHLAKSGTHLLYMIKHLYRDLYPSVSKDEIELRFQHPSVILRENIPAGIKLEALVFVDDFIGSGKTSVSSFKSFHEAYAHRSELRGLPTWYVTVAGFDRGVNRVVDEFPHLSGRILAASGFLTDEDRAFAWPGKIFDKRRECLRAKELCSEIGTDILRPYFRRASELNSHVLGWENDQALVAFEYNTPNNTLPIFWAAGMFRGRRWHPLFARWE